MGPWNDATDRQLMLSIIHLSAPQLPNWGAVAALMGEGFTAEAVRQHFQKLRKDSKAQFGDSGTSGALSKASAAKGTPRKKTDVANGTPKSTTGKKRKGMEHIMEKSGGIDDDDDESPTKKAAGKKDWVKKEPGANEESI